jgi:ubiquinone/menaquinone biosynthesis C-methylase UbiE
MERVIARELMDDEACGTPAQWRGALHDLARVNAYLGGWGALKNEVCRLPRLPLRILDVGSGGADLCVRLLDFLAARGVAAQCVALDRSARTLEGARAAHASRERLAFVQGDAMCLPLADGAFDLAMMNLALHHFDWDDAIVVLRELARVGQQVIVNDLKRSAIAWAFARFAFPVFTRNPLTRTDGPLSVRRAYVPNELARLAREAGWRSIAVRTHAGYRMTLAGGNG